MAGFTVTHGEHRHPLLQCFSLWSIEMLSAFLYPCGFVDTCVFCFAKHNPICCAHLAFVCLHVSNKPCLTVHAGAAVVSLRTQSIFTELSGLLFLKSVYAFSRSSWAAPLNTQYEPGGMVISTFPYSVIAMHIAYHRCWLLTRCRGRSHCLISTVDIRTYIYVYYGR